MEYTKSELRTVTEDVAADLLRICKTYGVEVIANASKDGAIISVIEKVSVGNV